MTRLIAIVMLLMLVVRLLTAFGPLLSPAMRQALERWRVALDVAGGLVMLLLIGIQVAYRQWLGAALLAALGTPVFMGMYKALPAWWYGSSSKNWEARTKSRKARSKNE